MTTGNTQSVKFIQAKRPRNELELPNLHFVACDDWMDKLGDRAFCAWLKFYTWADRTNPGREADGIPTSLSKIAKKLGCSRTTLYNEVLKKLWNYGMIDLQEVEIHGNICTNVIVYASPQNRVALRTQPLEKIRDYDQEYQSVGRVKVQRATEGKQAPLVQKMDDQPCPKNGQPLVQKMDNPLSKKWTTPCPKNGHSNSLNSFNPENISNSLNVCNVSAGEQPAPPQPTETEADPDRFPKLTDRLNEFGFGPKIKEKLIALTIKQKLTDEQAVNALNMSVTSGKADKLHFWNYLGVVYKEKAGIAKASAVIQAAQQIGQKRAVIEDELPAAIKRQKEREAQEERLRAEGVEIEPISTKTVLDHPELAEMYKALEKQHVKSGNPLVAKSKTPKHAEGDEKPF